MRTPSQTHIRIPCHTAQTPLCSSCLPQTLLAEYVEKSLTSDGRTPCPASNIELLCNDEVLTDDTDLAILKLYVWKKADPVRIMYRKKSASPATNYAI